MKSFKTYLEEGFKFAGGDSTELERLAVNFKLGLRGVKTSIRKSPKYGQILVVNNKVFIRKSPKDGGYLVYKSNGEDETKIHGMTKDIFSTVIRTAVSKLR